MQAAPAHPVVALSSIGAGVIHASAIGLHIEHPQLARVFAVVAMLQIAAGVALILRPSAVALLATLVVNAFAVGGWLVSRVSGISWIDGLESREAPGLADSLCAGLGVVAAAAALGFLVAGPIQVFARNSFSLFAPIGVIGVVIVLGMWSSTTHVHDHDAGAGHHDDSSATSVGSDHAHSDDAHATGTSHDDDHPHDDDWPRPYDPAEALDLSGVPGVTPEQESRAKELILATQSELPRWSDYDTAVAQGWISIGDESTGHEHLVNRALIIDDKFLDPSAPESLVYEVRDGRKTLVSAMFMAGLGVSIDDPELTDYAGDLMQWHVHDNLCFRNDAQGRSVVAGVTNADGVCPPGSILGGIGIAMVHVWIAPHPCGPFAALEGEGAGRAAVSDDERRDLCAHDHGASGGDGELAVAAAAKDDGTPRIDLSGMPGVSPEQQRRAEELVYRTRIRLPDFADVSAVTELGFTTIGDAGTGFEHFINWEYIDDEHELDPAYPESLVFQVDATTGERRLVSAMFMLGGDHTLDTVPDIGGPLTQWHVHEDLCFSRDPMKFGSTRVVGVTSVDGDCAFGMKLRPNPMIHVWIVPHPCGPFASLEGVGAGQIRAGEERLCDHAHGGH